MARLSKQKDTVGITLRLDVSVLRAYNDIAARANLLALAKGEAGRLTVQDVIRHRLGSLPWVKGQIVRKNSVGDK